MWRHVESLYSKGMKHFWLYWSVVKPILGGKGESLTALIVNYYRFLINEATVILFLKKELTADVWISDVKC